MVRSTTTADSDRMFLDCAPDDAVCNRYNSDEGVRTAWENLLKRFKARYPNKRMVLSTGAVTYKPVADQMAVFERILSLADGYFGETLTNDGAYFNDQPNAGKRTVLVTTMELASSLPTTERSSIRIFGMGDGTEPTQAQMDYGWAFFNLMRKGNWQFFSRVTKDAAGASLPEDVSRDEPVTGSADRGGDAADSRTCGVAISLRRSLTSTSPTPPSASLCRQRVICHYKNSLGQTVTSPLTLQSFAH